MSPVLERDYLRRLCEEQAKDVHFIRGNDGIHVDPKAFNHRRLIKKEGIEHPKDAGYMSFGNPIHIEESSEALQLPPPLTATQERQATAHDVEQLAREAGLPHTVIRGRIRHVGTATIISSTRL